MYGYLARFKSCLKVTFNILYTKFKQLKWKKIIMSYLDSDKKNHQEINRYPC